MATRPSEKAENMVEDEREIVLDVVVFKTLMKLEIL